MAAEPIRRLFTVDDYYQMGEAGILTAQDRVELIEGEIIEMPPIGGPHASHVLRLNHLFMNALGDVALVNVQNPLRLSRRSEPVPDLVLLRPRADFYLEHPTPRDVFLVVEVCDSSLAYDRGIKLPLYAREGTPEVWLVELHPQQISQHQDPTSNGYRMSRVYHGGDTISPLAFPHLSLAVADILG